MFAELSLLSSLQSSQTLSSCLQGSQIPIMFTGLSNTHVYRALKHFYCVYRALKHSCLHGSQTLMFTGLSNTQHVYRTLKDFKWLSNTLVYRVFKQFHQIYRALKLLFIGLSNTLIVSAGLSSLMFLLWDSLFCCSSLYRWFIINFKWE